MQIADITLPIGQDAHNAGLPGAQNYTPTNEGFGEFFSATLAALLVVAALLVLLYMTWGAIEWITSGGDKAKTEKARDKMTQSAIGLIVLASVLAIFTVLQTFLGIDTITIPDTSSVGGSTIRSVGGSASRATGSLPGGTTGAPTSGGSFLDRIGDIFGL